MVFVELETEGTALVLTYVPAELEIAVLAALDVELETEDANAVRSVESSTSIL